MRCRSQITAGHNPAEDRPADGLPFLLPSGPYAVRLAFRAGLEEPVEWIFARDLLSRGIQGIGDGHMRPSPGPAGGEPGGVLNIELILPYGQGSGHIDTDTELNDLLRQAS
jgi:hypothetical protein